MNSKPELQRLDTPRSTGYRPGMSSSCMIGQKLGRVYSVEGEVPPAIGEMLQTLHHKVSRSS